MEGNDAEKDVGHLGVVAGERGGLVWTEADGRNLVANDGSAGSCRAKRQGQRAQQRARDKAGSDRYERRRSDGTGSRSWRIPSYDSTQGFRTVTVTLTVRVGVNTSLEIHLEVGAVSSTVVVEATTVTVDTDKSTVQGVIEAAQIDQLPLNGRNFLDLAQMAPGVQVVDGGTFDPTKNQFAGVSVGGRSGRSTRIQVDGV